MRAAAFSPSGDATMPLRIRRSARARADQSAIWLHIAEDRIAAADRQVDRLAEAFGILADYPDAGRTRTELDTPLRAFPVDQYLIFYRVSPESLDVVRILHAARDITPDLLSE